MIKNLAGNAGDIRDAGSIPGLGRPSGRGNGNPLQSSCLENLMDRGDCQATVHRVAKDRTWLYGLSMHQHACTTHTRRVEGILITTQQGNLPERRQHRGTRSQEMRKRWTVRALLEPLLCAWRVTFKPPSYRSQTILFWLEYVWLGILSFSHTVLSWRATPAPVSPTSNPSPPQNLISSGNRVFSGVICGGSWVQVILSVG